ncbi:ATP-binding protein [Streptomyces sp. 049-1]|uniref:ATP-binding protein n=1 Tax=Streptomyces sp. 049-1 TaxID=2789264 RepID=UPI003980692B
MATPAAEKTVALTGEGECIGEAQDVAVGFLTRLRSQGELAISGRTVALAQLVVSELVTHAHKYAPGPILLRLRMDGEFLEVAVWDSDPLLPAASTVDPLRVGQHGLEIVQAVAHDLIVRPEPVGKRVTARIRV